jgi:predicted amidohydrolase
MLRIAIAQTPGTRLDQWRETRELVGEMIARASQERADLVLLPECLWPAYFIGSVEEYFQAREAGLPGPDAFLEQLTHLARAQRIAICAGYVAERERRLSNAATLISATGEVLGTHRKCFRWDFDYAFFEPGNEINPLETPWGPVGLMICADARLPEITATLVARGARLILHATAWVNVGTPETLWNPQPALLIPERAREFGLPIASASKWGIEGDTTFVGSSLICDAKGEVLAQCGTHETSVIVAEVSLEAPRRPELTPAHRARLLSSQPAVPPSASVPRLSVASLKDGSQIEAALNALRSIDALPALLVADAPGGHPAAGDDWLLLNGPTDQVRMLGAARVAAVDDRDANGFAVIRTLALDGVHLVVVFGRGASARTLRSRAAENRIFIVQVTASGISSYGPDGGEARTARPCCEISSEAASGVEALTLDIARSADKEFAPRTNPFTERRPEYYEF